MGNLWKLDPVAAGLGGVELGHSRLTGDLPGRGASPGWRTSILPANMVPPHVSVVSTAEMVKIGRLTTCN